MNAFICVTCGTQFTPGDAPPGHCPICEDERQYVGWDGQTWTTLQELSAEHRVVLTEEDDCLTGVAVQPTVAIGQRALLVRTPAGNVLWDCVPFIDEAAVNAIRALGGIDHIAISHPHFYTAMVEWAQAFGAQVHLHTDNHPYVMRPDPMVRYWAGETLKLTDGVTVIRCGGHFDGSCVLHWAGGAGGRGALLTGDTIMVVPDRRHVSFMTSYPNLIPMSARRVERIVASVAPFEFDRIYGGWTGRVVASDARSALHRSAERYVRAITS